MSGAVRSVPVEPESNGGGGEDHGSSGFTYELAQAALARSNEDAQRYGSIGALLERIERKADAAIDDLRALRGTARTTAEGVADMRVAMTRQEVRLQAVERAVRDDDHRHGEIVGALARIEARESKHQTRLQSITDEVTEVKAAHGGWLAVGSFMDRHRKVASTVAFLVLLGFQIFHLLRK